MDTPIPIDKKAKSLFYLLQVSDPLFPIGGFTQSYGLETYVQKGIVRDAQSSMSYLESYLMNNFLYNDLLAVRLAWEYSSAGDIDALNRLDNLLSAAKAPRELRTASIKLGIRFSKVVATALQGTPFFDTFTDMVRSKVCSGHYSVIYGLAVWLFSIDKTDAMSAVCYSTASAIVNNCAKLVPISQKDGQDILFSSYPTFEKLISKVEALKEDNIGTCCFGFDLRSMQHERLYTRLYIS